MQRASDRLITFSGIAKVYQKLFNDSYFAGRWGKRTHKGLLWSRGSGGSSRPADYHAPSWSWAWIEGHTYYDEELLAPSLGKEVLKVLEVRIDSVGNDSTDQIQRASLNIWETYNMLNRDQSKQESPTSFMEMGTKMIS